jgi:5'-nucleotidase
VRILLTNDDGIHAEGLAALRRIAAELSDDVWICAPEIEQSGAGRALTLSDPVRVRQIEPRVFAVSGTPTDCAMIAIQELVIGKRPDLVLSGVNRGQNMAEDVTLSGTVAGALQGMAMGIPSISLSQALMRFDERVEASFDVAEHYGPGLIQRLISLGWPEKVILNVNFPPVSVDQVRGVEVTRQGARDQHHLHFERRMDLRGRDYFWLGFQGQMSKPDEGTDLAAVYGGVISVTPLHIDLTHKETVSRLKGLIGGAPPALRKASEG